MTVTNRYQREKPIVYGPEGLMATSQVTMIADDVLPDSLGRKILPEGMFFAGLTNSDRGRALPRTRLSAALAANATTIELKEPHAQFKNLDELWIIGCYARITFVGTVTGTDYRLVVDRDQVIVIPGNNTAATVAAATVTNQATLGFTDLGITVRQIGSTATIELFSTDSWSLSAPSELQIVSSDPGYFGNYPTPIGTLTAMNTIQANGSRLFTVSAANATNIIVPANTIVGTLVNKLLGVHIQSIDLTETAPNSSYEFSLSPIRACAGVYENNLPYMDETIRRDPLLSQLNINQLFYGKNRDFVSNFPII